VKRRLIICWGLLLRINGEDREVSMTLWGRGSLSGSNLSFSCPIRLFFLKFSMHLSYNTRWLERHLSEAEG
jgi:hypothetical protein